MCFLSQASCANAIHEVPHAEQTQGISDVKREHDVTVFDLVPADDFLQFWREDAEDLAVDVVNGRGEKQQRANHPPIPTDGNPNCCGGCLSGHDCYACLIIWSLQRRNGCVQLISAAEQQNLVIGLEFFVRAGIDDVLPVSFDTDDARAGLSAELEFVNQFSRRR